MKNCCQLVDGMDGELAEWSCWGCRRSAYIGAANFGFLCCQIFRMVGGGRWNIKKISSMRTHRFRKIPGEWICPTQLRFAECNIFSGVLFIHPSRCQKSRSNSHNSVVIQPCSYPPSPRHFGSLCSLPIIIAWHQSSHCRGKAWSNDTKIDVLSLSRSFWPRYGALRLSLNNELINRGHWQRNRTAKLPSTSQPQMLDRLLS